MQTLRALLLLALATTLGCDTGPDSLGSQDDSTFRALPTVCAVGGDMLSLHVSDFECLQDDWEVCEPGYFAAGATQKTCCNPNDELDCWLLHTLNNDECPEPDIEVCTRDFWLDTHACESGGGVAIRGPVCPAVEPFICAEGETLGGSAVCCGKRVGAACFISEDGLCPPTSNKYCSF
jgi:hypothetical protein